MDTKPKIPRRWLVAVGSAIAVVGLLLAIFGIWANGQHGLEAWTSARIYGVVLIIAGIVIILGNRRGPDEPSGEE